MKYIKKVKKEWGEEWWSINNNLYCLKFLIINRGWKSSYHCHHIKDETFIILGGMVQMEFGTYDDVTETRILGPGDRVRLEPNSFHSFMAINDSRIMEISTHHSDNDVERKTKSFKMNIMEVDIDGTLCTNTTHNYRKVKPKKKVIKKLNEKFDEGTNMIVLRTARGATTGKDWSKLTLKQLKKWKVKYHALSFNKPYVDEIWDDRAVDLTWMMS